VAQNPHIGIFNGPKHPRGGFFAALIEAGVDAGDDHIHLRQDFVVEVERSVARISTSIPVNTRIRQPSARPLRECAEYVQERACRRARWSWPGS